MDLGIIFLGSVGLMELDNTLFYTLTAPSIEITLATLVVCLLW